MLAQVYHKITHSKQKVAARRKPLEYATSSVILTVCYVYILGKEECTYLHSSKTRLTSVMLKFQSLRDFHLNSWHSPPPILAMPSSHPLNEIAQSSPKIAIVSGLAPTRLLPLVGLSTGWGTPKLFCWSSAPFYVPRYSQFCLSLDTFIFIRAWLNSSLLRSSTFIWFKKAYVED